jgi:hypothetical protein
MLTAPAGRGIIGISSRAEEDEVAEITPTVQNETAEQTAYRLMERVLAETWTDGTKRTQKDILEAYAAALEVVKGQPKR